ARAQGTRKPRTDLLGDPVEAHEWSEFTGLDTIAYTLKVNPGITPSSVLLHEELQRGRKFKAGPAVNIFHRSFDIHFKQSRKVLVQALSDLIDHGMPRAWVDGISKFVAKPAVAGSTVAGTFYPESRVLAVREDLLDDVANIRLEGLAFPEISASQVLRDQRVLANIIAHEIGHSIDFENLRSRPRRRAQSWSSPLFGIDTKAMEIFDGRDIFVAEGALGPALEELYRIYESDHGGLGMYLGYPFDSLPTLLATEVVQVTGIDEKGAVVRRKGRMPKLRDPTKRIALLRQIKSEGFAQGAALYFTHRPTIKRRAPTFFALMEEIVNGTPENETSRARDARLLRAFQRIASADDPKVDALEPTDHTAPESRQVRQEAARVSTLRAEGVAAELPTGDPDRAYTPEQLAVSKKGGFGEVKPKSLRDKIDLFVEKMKKTNYRSVRQGVVDQFQSFKDKDLLSDPIAHMLATMANSANSAHEAIMKYGIPLLDKSGAILVGTRVVERGTDDQGRIIRELERIEGPSKEGFVKGVEEILEPLGKEAPDWWKWVVAQRAQQLLDEGREKLFERQDIIDLLTYAEGELPGDPSRGSRLRLYQDVLDELMEVHFAIVDMNVQQGTISKKDAKLWKDHGLYVPFFRDLQELTTQADSKGPQTSAGLVFQTAVRRLKGAKDPLASPMQNMFDNWHHLIGSGLKNAAGARALQTAEGMGIVTRLNEPGKGVDRFTEKRRDTVFIRENGKKVWYQFNEATEGGRFTKEDHALVLQSLMGLHTEGLNHFSMRAMRFMKRQFTGIIVANPNFKIANLFRDSFQSAAIGGISSNPWRNLVQGWKATAETSATNIAGLSTGGFFEQSGYIHGSDPEAINRLTTKGVKRNTILDFTNPLVVRDLWRKYQAIGVRGENVNRAAVFETKLAQGKTLLEASFSARDLLDFTRNGSFRWVRIFGQTIPFFQARLQGLDRFGRGAMDPKQRAQFRAVTATYAMASLAAYLAIKDDDDYKQTEQWERDTYHFFRGPGDVLFRIPRPFELGAIGTIVERLAEQAVDKDAHAELFFDRLKFALGQTFAFNPIPQAALPVVELWGNKNFFTNRPIESLSMKNLPPEERRRIYTSETSVLLSRLYNTIAWEEISLSPVQIEHLAQGYWGWFGAAVLGTIDLLVTRPAIGEPPKPAPQLQDWPFMGRWVRESPQRHTAPAEVYFELLKDAQQTFNTIREARERGDAGRAQAIFRKNRALLAQRKGLVRTQRQLSKIQDQIVRINRSRVQSPETKRARINALRRQRERLLGSRLKRARTGGAL
ncbi:MAG: LPD38 domain-containing protein, partial [Nannocystaceae bacterium]